MSDDNASILPALARRSPWLHNEDPTAILGDPWGLPSAGVAFAETRPASPAPRERGRFGQAFVRLQHAVLVRGS